MSKSLQEQHKAKLAKTLNFSKQIIEGKGQLAQLEMGLKIKDTLQSVAIRTVFKDNGAIGYGVANVLVNRFINSFAFSTKLDATQIEILTVDTLEHFAYDSLEDIILFFKMARTGKFGVTKKAPDSNTIFGEWLPKYLDLKSQTREQKYQEQKAISNSNLNTKFVEQYKKKQNKKKRQEQLQQAIDDLTQNMDRQMLNDTILSWEKEKKPKHLINLLKYKRKTILK